MLPKPIFAVPSCTTIFGTGCLFRAANIQECEHKDQRTVCSSSNNPTMPQDFENLFSNLHLSRLKLEDCNIGPGGHLPALTQGLRKQCSTQSIETLSLSSNSLSQCLDWELQEFFDVIFSLPEVENVQLSLKDNKLTSQHLELLYRSWKYSLHKKQLNILHIGGNELPDPESELMEKITKISVHSTCI